MQHFGQKNQHCCHHLSHILRPKTHQIDQTERVYTLGTCSPPELQLDFQGPSLQSTGQEGEGKRTDSAGIREEKAGAPFRKGEVEGSTDPPSIYDYFFL